MKMDPAALTDAATIGGIFITIWILIDRVFEYMFKNNKHKTPHPPLFIYNSHANAPRHAERGLNSCRKTPPLGLSPKR